MIGSAPSSLRAGILLNLLSRVYASGISLIFVPIYVRFLGIEAYGLIGLLNSYLALATLLDIGTSSTLAHELAKARAGDQPGERMRDLVRSVELPFWGIMTIACGGVVLSAPWLAAHWALHTSISLGVIANALVMIALTIGFQIVAQLYMGGLIGLERQSLLNSLQILGATLRHAGAGLVLWKLDNSISALVSWQAAASVIQALFAMIALRLAMPRAERRPRFRLAVLRRVWRFAASMSGITAVGAVLQQIDKVILGALLPLNVFAHYAIASVIASNLSTITGPVYNAVFPRLSHLLAQSDRAAAANVFLKSSQVVSVLLVPVATLIVIFPAELLFLWIGDREVAENTAGVLRVLVLGATFGGHALMPYILMVSSGRSGAAFRIYLLAAMGLFATTYFLVLQLGAMGGALANVLCYGGAFVAMGIGAVRSLIPSEFRGWIAKGIILPHIAAAVPVLLIWTIMPQVGQQRSVLLFAFATAWLFATGACVLTASWFRRWLVQQFFSMHAIWASGSDS